MAGVPWTARGRCKWLEAEAVRRVDARAGPRACLEICDCQYDPGHGLRLERLPLGYDRRRDAHGKLHDHHHGYAEFQQLGAAEYYRQPGSDLVAWSRIHASWTSPRGH